MSCKGSAFLKKGKYAEVHYLCPLAFSFFYSEPCGFQVFPIVRIGFADDLRVPYLKGHQDACGSKRESHSVIVVGVYDGSLRLLFRLTGPRQLTFRWFIQDISEFSEFLNQGCNAVRLLDL